MRIAWVHRAVDSLGKTAAGINLQVDTGATLQMLPYGTYPGSSSQFIYCDKVTNLEISGGGTIDGQGQAWWEAYTNNSSLSRPLLLQLESCVGLYIHDITFQNPPYHHCGIRDSGGALANTGNLTLPAATAQNFSLGASSSTMAVTGNLTLDSTLNIASAGAGGFTATNYTLFTYTGSLSGQPTLGATLAGFEGYTYELNTNTAAKEVMLVVSPPSPPGFGTASFVSSSDSLILSGSGGVANGAYYVLTSTNIALPLNQWTPIATNQFNSSGNFIFTNPVPANVLQRFFRLQLP